ncbi:hypothetical protein SmJEL517_g01495 [Synchytrium microbalum]|uniref:Mediator of RNA polymerase II transcription subunit 31 n=1 Tax=Synchytrium microbalum TaxID=1806994 RepID=A0A507C9C4_9FUNG|nr:uncharacterized protein SmJEL517_g01495 [Synchytrium microbalum]TPX36202.1 hypothetical protein SmJEL517_g01495 [Synchytrium microbalum]
MTEIAEKTRFLAELEFVQCLANPDYLHYLAQNGCFGEPPFINYCKYLLYWTQPTYAKYIEFPYCLKMLRLLQDAAFRDSLKSPAFKQTLHLTEHRHWTTYRNRKELERQGPMPNNVKSIIAYAGPGSASMSSTVVIPASSSSTTGTDHIDQQVDYGRDGVKVEEENMLGEPTGATGDDDTVAQLGVLMDMS